MGFAALAGALGGYAGFLVGARRKFSPCALCYLALGLSSGIALIVEMLCFDGEHIAEALVDPVLSARCSVYDLNAPVRRMQVEGPVAAGSIRTQDLALGVPEGWRVQEKEDHIEVATEEGTAFRVWYADEVGWKEGASGASPFLDIMNRYYSLLDSERLLHQYESDLAFAEDLFNITPRDMQYAFGTKAEAAERMLLLKSDMQLPKRRLDCRHLHAFISNHRNGPPVIALLYDSDGEYRGELIVPFDKSTEATQVEGLVAQLLSNAHFSSEPEGQQVGDGSSAEKKTG